MSYPNSSNTGGFFIIAGTSVKDRCYFCKWYWIWVNFVFIEFRLIPVSQYNKIIEASSVA